MDDAGKYHKAVHYDHGNGSRGGCGRGRLARHLLYDADWIERAVAIWGTGFRNIRRRRLHWRTRLGCRLFGDTTTMAMSISATTVRGGTTSLRTTERGFHGPDGEGGIGIRGAFVGAVFDYDKDGLLDLFL